MARNINRKNGIKENWIKTDRVNKWKSEAEKRLDKIKQMEIGREYLRIPHPTLKNTFILKERK